MIYKLLTFLFVFTSYLNISVAQLSDVTPVTNTIYNSEDKIVGQNVLLTTADLANIGIVNLPYRSKSSLQLVSVSEPFPPIMYKVIPGSISNKASQQSNLSDIRFQKNGDLTHFAIYYDDSMRISSIGYSEFDSSNLLPKRTAPFYFQISDNGEYLYMDPHDYQVNEKKEKLFLCMSVTKINASCISGRSADTAVQAYVNKIVLLDSVDNIKLIWDPLDHMSPCEMVEEYNAAIMDNNILDWSHANSARWSNDGNILYSFRHIGVGKIDAETGEIIFRLGGNSPDAIPLGVNDNYYLQHDFQQREDGRYSLYSNGNSRNPTLKGLIYDIDEETNTATKYDQYKPFQGLFSLGTGNYDTGPDLNIMTYGIYIFPSNNKILGDIFDNNDELLARLYLERQQYTYQAHLTTFSPIKWRPIISSNGNTLFTDSLPELESYTWYEIINYKTVKKVGIGTAYQFDHEGTYTVEARQAGVEHPFYFVADPYTITTTAIRPVQADEITIFPNPTHGIVYLKDIEQGDFRVVDLLGREVFSGVILPGQQSVNLGHLPAGSYLFSIKNKERIFIATVILL